jgi:Zn-dependent protease with chaperone function
VIVHLAVALAAAAASGVVAEPLSHRLAPASAARLLTVMGVSTSLLTTWALFAISLGGLGRLPWLAESIGWCRSVTGLSHDVPAAVSVLATIGLVAVLYRAVRLVRRWRALATPGDHDGLAVIATPETFAYAVPGRPGHIVASRGMLVLLDGAERRAMLAHEQAHLDLAHHRYLRAAELAACLPLLGPVARAVRFATERWADEVAANAVGDRKVVARALSRAALATTRPTPAGAAGALLGTGVSERVSSLLDAPPASFDLRQAALLAGTTVALAATGAVTVRMHDVVAVLAHFCGVG